MTDRRNPAERAFEDQENEEVVEIDEDGQVRRQGETPPGKKKVVLRDPPGEYGSGT